MFVFFYLQFFTDYIVFTSEVIGQQLWAKLALDQMLYKETIQFLKWEACFSQQHKKGRLAFSPPNSFLLYKWFKASKKGKKARISINWIFFFFRWGCGIIKHLWLQNYPCTLYVCVCVCLCFSYTHKHTDKQRLGKAQRFDYVIMQAQQDSVSKS